MTAQSRRTRVLLVDDHQLLTDSLARLLATEVDIEVVGIAGSVAEAKQLARQRMDVVLMDYRLPDGTGAKATRAIKARWPSARVVMLTAVQDDETVLESIQAGADGYLTKDRAVEELEVLRALAGGLAMPDICDHLVISRNTLRTHVQNIMNKLHVHSKLEAVTVALRNRIIEPPRAGDLLY